MWTIRTSHIVLMVCLFVALNFGAFQPASAGEPSNKFQTEQNSVGLFTHFAGASLLPLAPALEQGKLESQTARADRADRWLLSAYTSNTTDYLSNYLESQRANSAAQTRKWRPLWLLHRALLR
jgi:hypothetical protein